jgi:predicted DNA-binding protein
MTMKVIAVRIDDDLADRLRAVAELEGTTQIEQIREAIDSHIDSKLANGDLAERAKRALAKIDAEVTNKKRVIASLLAAREDRAIDPSRT